MPYRYLLLLFSAALLMHTSAAAQPRHVHRRAIRKPAANIGIPVLPDEEALRLQALHAAQADAPFRCIAEQMPEFPGDLRAFISEHLRYPDSVQDDIAGRVIVQFIIHADGSPGDAKVIRSLHPRFDAEALRLAGLPALLEAGQEGRQAGRCTVLSAVHLHAGLIP